MKKKEKGGGNYLTDCSILPNASSVVFIKLSFAKPLANTGMLFRSKSQTTSTLVALVSETKLSVSNRVPVRPFTDVGLY
jgi:hypothetical protein